MVIYRSDFASQLRREPGRVIKPTEVSFLRIILPLDVVVQFHTMKMIPRRAVRMIASRVVVAVRDQVEETMAMQMEMEEATVIHHPPNRLIRVPRRIKRKPRGVMGVEMMGMMQIRILTTVMKKLSGE